MLCERVVRQMELLGHSTAVCSLQNWLLFLLVEFSCCSSLHVFMQSVLQLSILLVSSFNIQMLFTEFSIANSHLRNFNL